MDHGDIRSPTQDGEYLSNLLCEYKIKLPDNSRIKITFISFSLEGSDGCIADSLSVSNKNIHKFNDHRQSRTVNFGIARKSEPTVFSNLKSETLNVLNICLIKILLYLLVLNLHQYSAHNFATDI